jgi:hypothetical protein
VLAIVCKYLKQQVLISIHYFYVEDFRPEECDSDKCDLKMVAIAAIMVAILTTIFNIYRQNT